MPDYIVNIEEEMTIEEFNEFYKENTPVELEILIIKKNKIKIKAQYVNKDFKHISWQIMETKLKELKAQQA